MINNDNIAPKETTQYCEGTEYEGTEYVYWLVYSPMLIPRQLRFSLYSGAVITEG